MKVVIDTNVLLVSISTFSKYHWLFQSIIKVELELGVANEILSEYAEKLYEKLGEATATNTLRTLLELQNVVQIVPYFPFQLITADPDDNKFADCAFAHNADFLITNDKHFNILKTIDFPKINVVRIEEFEEFLKQTR